MIKKDIVAIMASKSGLSRRVCSLALIVFVQALSEMMAEGEECRLTGFGTFRPFRRNAYRRENNITGMVMEVPAKIIPKFTAGEAFIEQVNAMAGDGDNA